MKLTVATSQFPVSAEIGRNLSYVRRQMYEARKKEADVIHFPEASLSGYAGVDFTSYDRFDPAKLRSATREIMHLAMKLRIWVVLGSTHPLTGDHKPHNSIYVINDRGEIVDRYDKRFCAGDLSEQNSDLAFYSPGNHFSVFDIQDIRCGVMICHEFRYPELYRVYKRMGVQLMFHSYHAGNIPARRYREMQEYVGSDHFHLNFGPTIPAVTMPAAMVDAAASNYMWISSSNTSARESCWPAFFVRPDGVITGRLRRNVAGLLLTTMDTDEAWYDSTSAWRMRAMRGTYHSGTLVVDPRSEQRTML